MRRYWSAHDIEPIRLGSDEAYAEAMREHLDRAVRRQLRSAHPVGCFLSGGLELSSVAALAARALAKKGKRLPAYTHVPRKGFDGPPPRGWYADETPYVEAIRQALETIDVTYVDNGSYDDFAALEAVFHATDLPVRNPTNIGWFFQIGRQAKHQRTAGPAMWRMRERHDQLGRLGTDGRPSSSRAAADRLSSMVAALRSIIQVALGVVLDAVRRSAHAQGAGGPSCDRRAHPHRIAPWQDHAAIRPEYAQAIGVDERRPSGRTRLPVTAATRPARARCDAAPD